MKKIKVEIELMKVEDGVALEIKLEDDIYRLVGEEEIDTDLVQEKLIEPHLETEEISEKQQNGIVKDRGRKLGMMRNNAIYENILNEIMVSMGEGKKYPELERIMAQYHPGCKKSTYHTYVKEYKKYAREIEHVSTTVPEKVGSEKGNVIAQLGGNNIHENILTAISQGIKDGMGKEDLIGMIKAYHPNVKSVSHYVYLRAYLRYMASKNGGERPVLLKTKKKTRRKKGYKGYSWKYNTWIKKKEYDIVNQAVNKWQFVATSESISELTGLPIWRVRATLDLLLQKHKIYLTFKNKQRRYSPSI